VNGVSYLMSFRHISQLIIVELFSNKPPPFPLLAKEGVGVVSGYTSKIFPVLLSYFFVSLSLRGKFFRLNLLKKCLKISIEEH